MPPEDNTGAPAAAPATIIEPQPAAPPQAAVADSGAAAAPSAALPLAAEAAAAAPAAAPEALPAAAPEKPAIELHTETPSLLATAGEPAKDAAKQPAAEPAKPGEAPAAEPAIAASAEPVTFEAFTLPEGVTLAEDRVKEFTDTLVNPELAPQDRAQALVDMHVQAIQQYADQTLQNQHKAFGDMRRDWRTEVMADEELGGAGHQTAMNAIARMRDLFVPANRREAFNKAMDDTGAGDHPEILRAFHNAARLFDEPAPPPGDPKPPPNNGRRPSAGAHGGFYETVGSGQGPAGPNNR